MTTQVLDIVDSRDNLLASVRKVDSPGYHRSRVIHPSGEEIITSGRPVRWSPEQQAQAWHLTVEGAYVCVVAACLVLALVLAVWPR